MAVEVTEKLESIVERYRSGKSSLTGVMQDISQEYGYLPEEVLQEMSRLIEVPISIFYSLATFYSSFRLEPVGKKHICACVGTACHVRRSPELVDEFSAALGIEPGQTTADGEHTTDLGVIVDDLLDAAREGLLHRGVPPEDADRYLDPLRRRAERDRTPARWKHDAVARRVEAGEGIDEAVPAVQRAYVERQTRTLIDGTFAEWDDA